MNLVWVIIKLRLGYYNVDLKLYIMKYIVLGENDMNDMDDIVFEFSIVFWLEVIFNVLRILVVEM